MIAAVSFAELVYDADDGQELDSAVSVASFSGDIFRRQESTLCFVLFEQGSEDDDKDEEEEERPPRRSAPRESFTSRRLHSGISERRGKALWKPVVQFLVLILPSQIECRVAHSSICSCRR